MSEVRLHVVKRPFTAELCPPGSKSLTNRALVLGALAEGSTELRNCLFADDTLVMIEALKRLGFDLRVNRAQSTIVVHGQAGRIPAASVDLFCGNSGTSMRFLTAVCALGHGRFVVDGVLRMRQRPIGQLVGLLRNLGVRVNCLMNEGFPPVEVLGDGLPGGIARFGSAQSSQFLSAVLQIAPLARNEVRIDLEGEQTSWPYVAMTMQLMDHFGVMSEVLLDKVTGQPRMIAVPQGKYRGGAYTVEPDASSASYFLAAAALHGGSEVTIHGLGKRSLQGDVAFADVLGQMGASVDVKSDSITISGAGGLRGIDADLVNMPDVAQTLAVVALFAHGQTRISGLHTLRLKETDRIAALVTELRKLGAEVDSQGDELTIKAPLKVQAAAVDTYDDHRMAMSFALAATRIAGVVIKDAQCVRKTYPGFFDDLRKVLASHPRQGQRGSPKRRT